ncbi:MAG: polysaccharide biosynthesis tyrosine autokinase [Polyangiaceae bacterium]|nr:polysaccharide biosynthesis tyrosine autokinase [Polyangiaceae bacterium]
MDPLSTDAPAASGGSFRFVDVARLVLKHVFWVVLCAVLFPGAAFLWTKRQTKIYESVMSVVFDFPSVAAFGRKVDGYDPYSDYLSRASQVEVELQLLQSQRVVRQAVLETGLHLDQQYVRANFGPKAGKLSAEDVAASIRGRIRVEIARNGFSARIFLEDADPPGAKRALNGLLDTYTRISAEDALGSSGAVLEFLGQQLTRLQRDVESSELALHDFKLKRNLLSVALNDQSNLLREEIDSLTKAVTQASIRRAHLAARSQALASVTHNTPDNIPAQELLADPLLSQMRAQYLTAKLDLANQEISNRGKEHPDVRAARAKMEHALDAYIVQVRNLQGAAAREAQVFASEAGALRGMLEKAKARALDLSLQEIEYKRLARSAVTNQKVYDNILDRMKDVDLSRTTQLRAMRVVDAPSLPSSPIRPKVSANVAAGLGLGVLMGLLIAVARELSDRTIKTPQDMEQKLGIPALGVIPIAADSAKKKPARRRGETTDAPELIVHFKPTSMIAEAARSIRSNVLFMNPDHPPKVILITSALAGEGKTTTATTLAATFAQTGKRVVIVDIDLRRPRLHRVFGVSSQIGVTTCLLGESLDEALSETVVPNLWVLPCGPTPPNPAELVMSDRMSQLLKELSSRFDRVIVDSPPVNPVADASILATRVDGTILVSRAFETGIDHVRAAKRSLVDVKASILGGILNAVDLKRSEYKYSYYYRSDGYASAEADAAE